MNANFEKFNYLNLINPRLGRLYNLGVFDPLPDDFVLTKKIIEERLRLYQIAQNVNYPQFIHGDKNEVKNAFKTSVKNLNKLSKTKPNCGEAFAQKIGLYIAARKEVTKELLKEFKSYRFDECEAYDEIYAIDPIFCDLMDLFEKDFDPKIDFSKLEEEYVISYAELLKLQNARQKKNEKSAKNLSDLNENLNKIVAAKSGAKNIDKNSEKLSKNNSQKIVKKSKIASPNAKNDFLDKKSPEKSDEKISRKITKNGTKKSEKTFL